ncbi:MAG: Holliday junction resolvase RuvX [Flavobacteriaceae bacterium]|jgi:putative Holliday junction resolvase|nr:Holliday junction resolvase RuvX [Flavobacteriaceae bacterium]MDG2504475.1 Holliday junction resolvase RuvX [Flavobacteriaceae bacterium]
MGSLVGIDFGKKRTGLACTDPLKIIASGLKNLPTPEVIPFLKKYCETEQVDIFVLGKPLQKDGAPSEVEVHILKFIKKLQNHFPEMTIERYDERYTSKMAVQSMIDGGLTKKKRADKGMIDQVSATLILQSYLDYKTNTL